MPPKGVLRWALLQGEDHFVIHRFRIYHFIPAHMTGLCLRGTTVIAKKKGTRLHGNAALDLSNVRDTVRATDVNVQV